MPRVMKLKDSEDNELEFSPLIEYKSPEQNQIMEKYAIDGTLYLIKRYKKLLHNIPLKAISVSDYAQFLTWWQDRNVLTFYPDLINNPTNTLQVQIINTENPFNPMFNNALYEGVLAIKEI